MPLIWGYDVKITFDLVTRLMPQLNEIPGLYDKLYGSLGKTQ